MSGGQLFRLCLIANLEVAKMWTHKYYSVHALIDGWMDVFTELLAFRLKSRKFEQNKEITDDEPSTV